VLELLTSSLGLGAVDRAGSEQAELALALLLGLVAEAIAATTFGELAVRGASQRTAAGVDLRAAGLTFVVVMTGRAAGDAAGDLSARPHRRQALLERSRGGAPVGRRTVR